MSATSNTSFHNWYVEHKCLTRIVGEPTFSTIQLILLQLKVNTISALSTLGGGKHNYIGVILSPVTYETLAPMQPFELSGHPGILQIVHLVTQYEIALAKTLHNKSVRTVQSYQLIQRALVQ